MSASILDLVVVIDVICPWCYVGKRRMEKALTMLDAPADIRVQWFPFELNPDMPKEGMERRLYRIGKFGSWEHSQRLDAQLTQMGAQAGIGFRYDLMLRTPNTFDAHRLIWKARQTSGGQEPVVETLFRAYFCQGRDVGDPEVLAGIAGEAGMNRADIAQFLDGEEGRAETLQNENAARNAGISGVPAFIINGRQLLMGAQPPEVIAQALRAAMGLAPVA